MDTFSIAVRAFRAFNGVAAAGRITGKVVLKDGSMALVQELMDDNTLSAEFFFESKTLFSRDVTSAAYRGKTVDITFLLCRSENGLFASDLDDLLQWFTYRNTIPERFFLADLNYQSGEDNPKPLVVQYLNTIKFIDFLRKISDHTSGLDTNTLKLIFFQKEKLEIDVVYSDTDLCDLPSIQGLVESLESDAHKEQKMILFKEALITMLRAVDGSIRFAHLLKNFAQIIKRYEDNFALYVSEFSFEKVQEEWEQRKIEYIAKFNQVITDTQDKILVIPVALILVGGEMEAKGHLTLKNVSILVGSIFFSALMWILIRNQHHTLVALHTEVLALKQRTEDKHQGIASRIEDVFIALSTRYKSQKRRIFLIQAIVLSGLLFSCAIFIRYTPETWWIFSKTVSLLSNPPF